MSSEAVYTGGIFATSGYTLDVSIKTKKFSISTISSPLAEWRLHTLIIVLLR